MGGGPTRSVGTTDGDSGRVDGPYSAGQGRRVPAPAIVAILATSALGLLDECLQLFVPSRVFDPRDILFNVLAGALAVGRASRWHGRGGGVGVTLSKGE